MNRILFSIILSFIATATNAFDCEDKIKQYDICNASTQFTDTYKIICRRGNELSSNDLNSMYKQLEREVEENECLAKCYEMPRVDREAYKDKYYETRDRKREMAEERRNESIKNMEAKLEKLKAEGKVPMETTFDEYYYENKTDYEMTNSQKKENNKSSLPNYKYEYIKQKYGPSEKIKTKKIIRKVIKKIEATEN